MVRVVVIGNGMVGYKFCEKILAKTNSSNPLAELVSQGMLDSADGLVIKKLV